MKKAALVLLTFTLYAINTVAKGDESNSFETVAVCSIEIGAKTPTVFVQKSPNGEYQLQLGMGVSEGGENLLTPLATLDCEVSESGKVAFCESPGIHSTTVDGGGPPFYSAELDALKHTAVLVSQFNLFGEPLRKTIACSEVAK